MTNRVSSRRWQLIALATAVFLAAGTGGLSAASQGEKILVPEGATPAQAEPATPAPQAAAPETGGETGQALLTDEQVRRIVAEEVGDDPDITVDYDKIPRDISEQELREKLRAARAMADSFRAGLEGAVTEEGAAAKAVPEGERLLSDQRIREIFAAETTPEDGLTPDQFIIGATTTEEELKAKIGAAKTLKAAMGGAEVPEAELTAALALVGEEFGNAMGKAMGEAMGAMAQGMKEGMEAAMGDLAQDMETGMAEEVSGDVSGDVSGEIPAAEAVGPDGTVMVSEAEIRTPVRQEENGQGAAAMAVSTKTTGKEVRLDFPRPNPDWPRPAAFGVYVRFEFASAIKMLEEEAKRHPDNPAIFYYLGYALYKQKRFSASRKAFTTAYQLDPGYTPSPFFTKKG